MVNTLRLTELLIYINFYMVTNYNAMITELEEELTKAIKDRDKLMDRIDALITAIQSVKELAEEASDEKIISPRRVAEDAGFTEQIRTLFQLNAAKSFTPVEIREVLMEFHEDADPKVVLIHVHNTVKRLHKQGEIEEVNRVDGRGYRLKSIMAKERMTQIKATMPKIGVDLRPNSAYESGMRGDEEPKK